MKEIAGKKYSTSRAHHRSAGVVDNFPADLCHVRLCARPRHFYVVCVCTHSKECV